MQERVAHDGWEQRLGMSKAVLRGPCSITHVMSDRMPDALTLELYAQRLRTASTAINTCPLLHSSKQIERKTKSGITVSNIHTRANAHPSKSSSSLLNPLTKLCLHTCAAARNDCAALPCSSLSPSYAQSSHTSLPCSHTPVPFSWSVPAPARALPLLSPACTAPGASCGVQACCRLSTCRRTQSRTSCTARFSVSGPNCSAVCKRSSNRPRNTLLPPASFSCALPGPPLDARDPGFTCFDPLLPFPEPVLLLPPLPLRAPAPPLAEPLPGLPDAAPLLALPELAQHVSQSPCICVSVAHNSLAVARSEGGKGPETLTCCTCDKPHASITLARSASVPCPALVGAWGPLSCCVGWGGDAGLSLGGLLVSVLVCCCRSRVTVS